MVLYTQVEYLFKEKSVDELKEFVYLLLQEKDALEKLVAELKETVEDLEDHHY
jgi:hypothetical protein